MPPAVVRSTSAVLYLTIFLTALGRPDAPRPTQGFQIGKIDTGYDIILPVSVAQCEPVLIYYNLTNSATSVSLYTPDCESPFLNLYLPIGHGYLDWVCNIPSGEHFIAWAGLEKQYYTVNPGSSSACLGDLSGSFSIADYHTAFHSYTQYSYTDLSSDLQLPTTAFPTGSFPTITANQIIGVASATSESTVTSSALSSQPTSSPPTSSPPASTSPVSSPSSSSASSPPLSYGKLNRTAIISSVIGGVTFVLLAVTLIYIFWWKRRKGTAVITPFAAPRIQSINNIRDRIEPTPPITAPATKWQNSAAISPLPVTQIAAGTGPNLSLTPTARLVPHNPDANLSSRPELPISETTNTNARSDLASALDAASRLTDSQRQRLIACLNSSTNPVPGVQMSSISEAQDDFPDLAAVLGVISRARLSARERDALVASLNNLLVPDQSTLANFAGRSGEGPMSSPPPYSQ